MVSTTPDVRPSNPRFSSGPCAKPPHWSLDKLSDAPLGRSHRAAIGKSKLAAAIEDALSPLGVTIDELPLSPNRLRRLIREAQAGRS